MLFSQVWILRRAIRSNMAKLQTFPLEKPHGSISGLRFPLVFWMSFHKDYDARAEKQIQDSKILLTTLHIYFMDLSPVQAKIMVLLMSGYLVGV